MRKLTNILLVILSYSPIATIAVAAQAKASEMDGQDQSVVLANSITAARQRVLPIGSSFSTMESARQRYKTLTGLDGQQLDDNLKADLNMLREKGILNFDEKNLVGHGPSIFAE